MRHWIRRVLAIMAIMAAGSAGVAVTAASASADSHIWLTNSSDWNWTTNGTGNAVTLTKGGTTFHAEAATGCPAAGGCAKYHVANSTNCLDDSSNVMISKDCQPGNDNQKFQAFTYPFPGGCAIIDVGHYGGTGSQKDPRAMTYNNGSGAVVRVNSDESTGTWDHMSMTLVSGCLLVA